MTCERSTAFPSSLRARGVFFYEKVNKLVSSSALLLRQQKAHVWAIILQVVQRLSPRSLPCPGSRHEAWSCLSGHDSGDWHPAAHRHLLMQPLELLVLGHLLGLWTDRSCSQALVPDL